MKQPKDYEAIQHQRVQTSPLEWRQNFYFSFCFLADILQKRGGITRGDKRHTLIHLGYLIQLNITTKRRKWLYSV